MRTPKEWAEIDEIGCFFGLLAEEEVKRVEVESKFWLNAWTELRQLRDKLGLKHNALQGPFKVLILTNQETFGETFNVLSKALTWMLQRLAFLNAYDRATEDICSGNSLLIGFKESKDPWDYVGLEDILP